MSALAPANQKTAVASFICPVNKATIRCMVDEAGQPWFVARETAAALGYSLPQKAVIDHCKYAKLLKGSDSEHLTTSPRGIMVIPEPDLYRLIMRSNLPSAEAFQDWVYHEVLPSIRKYGAYITQSTLDKMLVNPDYCLAVIASLDAERRQRRELEEKICVMEPKALVYDTVVADRQPTLRQFARRLGRVNLNLLTRDLMLLGYLHRQGGNYHPYAKYKDTHFAEKVSSSGVATLIVLDKGKQLLTQLWQEGKLTRRK